MSAFCLLKVFMEIFDFVFVYTGESVINVT